MLTYNNHKSGYEHLVPTLANSIKIIYKIISIYPHPEDEFMSTLDQCVELRRNIIEVINISNEEEVKEMILRIPKPTLNEEANIRKVLQTIGKSLEGKNYKLNVDKDREKLLISTPTNFMISIGLSAEL